MKIAVEGCSHGELDKIYASIQEIEKQQNFKVDVLLCCGDFQAVRNRQDLQCMAVPAKYRHMQDFHKYYSGEKEAPILTVFIGGNHEASGYLAELPYGGWVCPNIFYMGYASIVRIANLRIGGLSGIYKGPDYLKGHFECAPYDEGTKRSAYHVRNVDVFRLKQLSGSLDVFMSHDWPRGVYHHGNIEQLLRRKPFFRQEAESNTLGSRPAEELLGKLQPSYWFSGHLHVKFSALVEHKESSKVTRFLALDKCLPRRKFLQILDIPHDGDLQLHYDPEWLSILQSTNHLLSIKNGTQYMPGPGCDERWNFTPSSEELENVSKLFDDGNFEIPSNFEKTAEPFCSSSSSSASFASEDDRYGYVNPQTTRFCELLGIGDPNAMLLAINKANNDGRLRRSGDELTLSTSLPLTSSSAAENVTMDDINSTYASLTSLSSTNPDEISLGEEDEDDDREDDGANEICDKESNVEPEVMHLSTGLSLVVDRKPQKLFVAPEFHDREGDCKRKPNPVDQKVFKRRNQAIYAQKDEEDEESS